MKLDLPEIEIQRSKSFQQTTFEIGDPRVIFNILRSKMYSRPIRGDLPGDHVQRTRRQPGGRPRGRAN